MQRNAPRLSGEPRPQYPEPVLQPLDWQGLVQRSTPLSSEPVIRPGSPSQRRGYRLSRRERRAPTAERIRERDGTLILSSCARLAKIRFRGYPFLAVRYLSLKTRTLAKWPLWTDMGITTRG